jgi:site-specific recombinase XerD
MRRLLEALRDAGLILPARIPELSEHEQIFQAFSDYLEKERGLASTTMLGHLLVVRQFLRELCPAGASDFSKLKPEDVIRYIERHARDWSAGTSKTMCWSLRSFLRYLYRKGLLFHALADCVPSIRRRKFSSLPTFYVRSTGSKRARQLQSNNRYRTAGLRDSNAAGEARFASERSCDAHLGRHRLAVR